MNFASLARITGYVDCMRNQELFQVLILVCLWFIEEPGIHGPGVGLSHSYNTSSEVPTLLPTETSSIFPSHMSKRWLRICSLCFHAQQSYFLELISQSCLTLCVPMDCSLPCSSVRGILQVRILEWVAVSSSRGSSWPRDRSQVSYIAGRLFT